MFWVRYKRKKLLSEGLKTWYKRDNVKILSIVPFKFEKELKFRSLAQINSVLKNKEKNISSEKEFDNSVSCP